MSSTIWSTINPAVTSGNQLATLLNDFKEAMVSGLSGTTRPTELDPGGMWIDTTLGGSPTFTWQAKLWTGTYDVVIFNINLATGTSSISGSDSIFEVFKFIADNTGPVLKMTKKRIANNGQVQNGDTIATVQFVGGANDSSTPTVATIKAISSDDYTASASGTYLVFEATADGTTGVSEMMRLVDGRLGIGVTTPSNTVHARGTGVLSENRADSAVGGYIAVKKSRVSGSGQVLNNDVVGLYEFASTTDTGANIVVAKLEATAQQNHTSSNQGTKLTISTKQASSNTYTEDVEILNGQVFLKSKSKLNSYELVSQDIDPSTGSTLALSAEFAIAIVTGGTPTAYTVHGIDASGKTKVVTVHNKQTPTVTIKHNSGSASAANRISLPGSKDIVLQQGESLELFYDTAATLWKIKSGSGGSGGGLYTGSVQTPGAGGTLTVNTDARQLIEVSGNAAAVTLSTTPFGSGTFTVGQEFCVTCTSDTNTVSFVYTDSSKGVVGPFSTLTLYKYQTATFVYTAQDRFVYKGVNSL